jgi:hypothetical protein
MAQYTTIMPSAVRVDDRSGEPIGMGRMPNLNRPHLLAIQVCVQQLDFSIQLHGPTK